jgi:hypothetical protein
MMISLAVAYSLTVLAHAGEITPDWNKLTDFKTGIKVNLDSVLAKITELDKLREKACRDCSDPRYCSPNPQYCSRYFPGPPVKKFEGSFNLQLDVAAERLKFEVAHAEVEYPDHSRIPPPLRGQKASGQGSLAFDAGKGFIQIQEKGHMGTQMGAFGYEFCAKVNFPKGLLPPGQAILAQLDQKKQQITGALNHFPHTEATVDGNSVAVFSQPAHPPTAPAQFVAVMHDATPVGYGINTPPSGNWEDASLKFNGWTHGAGDIADEPCVEMSATELLQSYHANRSLWAFDQIIDLMSKQDPLQSVMALAPAQPSKIFETAAMLESLEASRTRFSESLKVGISSVTVWTIVAMATVGGALGASFVLLLSSRRAPAHSLELLG